MNDMNYAYYPGCTLDSSAREINDGLKQVCRHLDIHINELSDWNCCGSSSIHAVRPQLAVSLSARNLFNAQSSGMNLMVMCAGCTNRLRSAAHQLRESPTTRRVNEQLFQDRLDKDLVVNHLLDLLPQRIGQKPWAGALVRPLTGLRYVAYYGCLLAAPPELRQYPSLYGSMESIMKWLGADHRTWGYEAKCCGAFLSVARPDIVSPMVDDIMKKAKAGGAECIITACAMCQLNLELRSRPKNKLPVFSIVELLAFGLGSDDWKAWFKRHMVDPIPLFERHHFYP